MKWYFWTSESPPPCEHHRPFWKEMHNMWASHKCHVLTVTRGASWYDTLCIFHSVAGTTYSRYCGRQLNFNIYVAFYWQWAHKHVLASVHDPVSDGNTVNHNCIVVTNASTWILKYILLVTYEIRYSLICYFMFTWTWNSFSFKNSVTVTFL